ncbi:MAG: T9SS type A sorting domain-containing protein, partial [Ignavibacteriaceae bacterium]|nr:T9SS type A sorting domain-containing protein [Ignavibacteriaceae bacterium]
GFGTSHLFRSLNSGASWSDIGQGLPDVPTSAVCIDPFNSYTLYVGNDLGVYYSHDNGISWNSMNSGLTGTALVMDLAVSPIDYKLVVATHGRGVYKIPLSTITPVELIAFTSQIVQTSVLLNWTTTTELNNYGFEIQRSTEIDSWRTIGFVSGHGTSQIKNNYSFKDINVISVKGINISYRLKQNDFNGNSTYSNVITVSKNSIPNGFALQQNYPNPFNGGSIINFSIPEQANVSLILYDITGREIKVLLSGFLSAGQHQVSISNKDFDELSSGVYLYKLTSAGYSAVKKMIVLK